MRTGALIARAIREKASASADAVPDRMIIFRALQALGDGVGIIAAQQQDVTETDATLFQIADRLTKLTSESKYSSSSFHPSTRLLRHPPTSLNPPPPL